MQMYEFIARNLHTGEVCRGSLSELAERIGVVSATISKSAISGYKIRGTWEVDKVLANVKENDVDPEFRKEWNETVAPFRELSRRRRNRNATDNATKKV